MQDSRIEELVDQYGADIYRCAYFYLGDRGWAEDASQQVLLKVYQNRDQLDSLQLPRSWILRITVNQCKNILKSKAFRSRQREQLLEDSLPGPSRMQADLEQREQNTLIAQEVRRLPGKYRDAVVLKYIKDYTTQEIAGILGIRPASVRSRLSRATALLRQRLEGRIDLSE